MAPGLLRAGGARARRGSPFGELPHGQARTPELLGIQFEGIKGEHFFRSTLVQTLFYGSSAWIFWRRTPESRVPDAQFNWRLSAYYLRVPVLRKLFGEVAEPGALNSIQLQEVLDLAGEALNRIQPAFFVTFREDEAVAYFYEPFLKAFDPTLRKELGVWYTPKEIVQYMVERVDQLLRTELGQTLGLASPAVRILDPCCGTGAYLTAVLHRIHELLEQLETHGSVPNNLRSIALSRVFGLIMPAPFVISHLQIASLLEDATRASGQSTRGRFSPMLLRVGFLRTSEDRNLRGVRHEREDSKRIKQQDPILVILGNPPYNGYAGIAKIEEERDLTDAYRAPVSGLPAPQGQGLNDPYIRFFRIAERRVAANSNGRESSVLFPTTHGLMGFRNQVCGTTTYIHSSNSLLTISMATNTALARKRDGFPDPSAFSTPQNHEGIQLGTAITTLVRNRSAANASGALHLRDLWGVGN